MSASFCPRGLRALLAVLTLILFCVSHTGPARADPVRVLVMGDSMAAGLYRSLYRHYAGNPRVVVEQNTKVSSGLTRPDFHDWIAEAQAALRGRRDIDVIVWNIGLNDNQALHQPNGRDFVRRDLAAWDRGYGRRVAAMIQIFRSTGAEKVLWVGLPIASREHISRHYTRMNRIYQAEARDKGATFIEAWRPSMAGTGSYTSHFTVGGRRHRLRADDGIHFTAIGYDHINKPVIAIIDELASGSRWEGGEAPLPPRIPRLASVDRASGLRTGPEDATGSPPAAGQDDPSATRDPLDADTTGPSIAN